ncbi:hypothetical protein C2E23DRAFT_103433 [Lenzites betulinus]|nr:hypothetical protein C2E23DRAFT_103433 [Lenzites betulinus]
MPRLPAELLILVFENIKTRKQGNPKLRRPDLAACSRVCREWRAVALVFVFQEVELTVDRDFRRFLAFVQAERDLASFICGLRIWRDRHNNDHNGHPLQPALLFDILSALPGIRRLELSNVVLLGWPQSTSLPAKQIKLESLTFAGITINYQSRRYSHSHPFDILGLFCADTVKLSALEEGDPGWWATAYIRRSLLEPQAVPAIRSLHLISDQLPAVCFLLKLNHIYRGLERGTLTTLCLELSSYVACKFLFDDFLPQYGESIRHMCLFMGVVTGICSNALYPTSCELLKAESLPHLESLRLCWPRYHRTTRRLQEIDAFPTYAYSPHDIVAGSCEVVLQTIASPALRTLSIGIPFVHEQTAVATMAKIAPHVVKLLVQAKDAQHRFPLLQHVTAEFGHQIDVEVAAEMVRGQLPEQLLQDDFVRFETDHDLCTRKADCL